jgi:Prokaryotic E2 family E
MYGATRFFSELRDLGFEILEVAVPDGQQFGVIKAFIVPVGKFAERTIDLALQVTADFPKTAPSAIHVRATPQLYDVGDTVANVRNIATSALGAEWRYWSHNFGWTGERSARHLMTQVNGVFLNAT